MKCLGLRQYGPTILSSKLACVELTNTCCRRRRRRLDFFLDSFLLRPQIVRIQPPQCKRLNRVRMFLTLFRLPVRMENLVSVRDGWCVTTTGAANCRIRGAVAMEGRVEPNAAEVRTVKGLLGGDSWCCLIKVGSVVMAGVAVAKKRLQIPADLQATETETVQCEHTFAIAWRRSIEPNNELNEYRKPFQVLSRILISPKTHLKMPSAAFLHKLSPRKHKCSLFFRYKIVWLWDRERARLKCQNSTHVHAQNTHTVGPNPTIYTVTA